ncbi:hypothetical protein C5167_001009 [Papaver somniferum]|uniref:Uncharacterized protein n=1 Tax=Papaver somniferum TaxID=3469 RepID=A0A4Y7KY23_PAPSO|nr:hypothetical protein C5167_001009 [Papaver somniferum]
MGSLVIFFVTMIFIALISDKGKGEGSVKETNLVNETVRFAMEYTDASPIGKRMSMGENSNNAAGLLPNPVADPQTGTRGKLHLINKLHTTHSWAFLEVNVIPQYNQLSTDMEALQNLTVECDLDSKQGSDYGEKEVVEGNVLMLEWLDGWFLCVSVLAVVLLYLEVARPSVMDRQAMLAKLIGSTVPQVLHGTPDKPLPTAASWKAAAGHISSLSSLSNLSCVLNAKRRNYMNW